MTMNRNATVVPNSRLTAVSVPPLAGSKKLA